MKNAWIKAKFCFNYIGFKVIFGDLFFNGRNGKKK